MQAASLFCSTTLDDRTECQATLSVCS